MAYCTVGNIRSYFLNKTFSSTDYCSEDNVEMFIDDDAAIIDVALRTRYTLPIVDADDLKVLRSINARMTVGTIDDIFREKTEDEKFDRGRGLRKEALKLLEEIKDGTVILNSSEQASPIKFNSINSDGDEVEKRFKDSHIDDE
jgi:phage gp36-like protein